MMLDTPRRLTPDPPSCPRRTEMRIRDAVLQLVFGGSATWPDATLRGVTCPSAGRNAVVLAMEPRVWTGRDVMMVRYEARWPGGVPGRTT